MAQVKCAALGALAMMRPNTIEAHVLTVIKFGLSGAKEKCKREEKTPRATSIYRPPPSYGR